MRSHGNTISNQIYNPKAVKPPVPIDVDEADSSMERYIRQKYQYRSLEEEKKPRRPSYRESVRARSPSSPEGSPPPLPPKGLGGRFRDFGASVGGRSSLRPSMSSINLRRPSSSMNAPFSSRPRRLTGSPPLMPAADHQHPVNGQPRDPAFESKMDALRQLGFQNERRNAIVLRELDGNFDKSIETLRRVGEGGGTTPSTTRPSTSSNPFDMLDLRPPAARANGSYNPFDRPQQQQSLENSFQGLQVSQPLFPHSTGGYPNGQVSAQSFMQQQQQQQPPLTPPVPGSLYQQQSTVAYPQNNPFFQMAATQQNQFAYSSSGIHIPAAQQQQQQQQMNPFFSSLSPQPTQTTTPMQAGQFTDIPTLRHANTVPTFSVTEQPSSFFTQQPPSPFQQQPAQNVNNNPYNPFQSSSMTNGSFQQQQLTPLAPHQTGRIVDKGSILSLYNLSPKQPPIIAEQPQQQQQQMPAIQNPPPPSASVFGPTRSATYPSLSPGEPSRNPFTSTQAATPQTAAAAGMARPPVNGGSSSSRAHMSQPSVDINRLQGGRHSPDAFASLSARYA